MFYDGGCLLCSSMVQWTHQHDKNGEIWFAALEGDFAARKREELSLPAAGKEAQTFVFWDEERDLIATKSDGAVCLLRTLGGVWSFLGGLMALCPRLIRNAAYDLIARNRRKWFGSGEACGLPEASLRERILP